jgi:peptidoglycan/LPS O-acetylase OafA/YrhL
MSRTAAFLWAAAGLCIAALILAAMKTWPNTTLAATFKYPPHLAYFWYGVGMSHLLYGLVQGLPRLPEPIEKIITWISTSSLWIYLWHIPGLQVARKIVAHVHFGEWSFLAMWTLTAAFAMIVTLIQQGVVQEMVQRARAESRLGRTLKIAFLN